MTDLPTVIDVEATGFGAGSYPIEVGVAFPDGGTWCGLIRPELGWSHWDPEAEAVHHISRDILATHGKAARDVALQLPVARRPERMPMAAAGLSWPATMVRRELSHHTVGHVPTSIS